MSTNKTRYDWQRVSPETLQELAQAASDHEDYSCPEAIKALGAAVRKARWQAVVMEIDSEKIDILAATEQYYNACTGNYIIGNESAALINLKLAIHKAFRPKP